MHTTATHVNRDNRDAEILIGEFRAKPSGGSENELSKSRGTTLEDASPLIKPGIYQMVYFGRYTTYLHGHSPKVALKFRITEIGPAFGVELVRWYNCKKLIGKPGKNGGFVPPRHGDFLLDYCTLFPDVLTRKSRLDRVSFTPFKNIVITACVDTVQRNSKQRKLPVALQYSTVRDLLTVGA